MIRVVYSVTMHGIGWSSLEAGRPKLGVAGVRDTGSLNQGSVAWVTSGKQVWEV